MGRRSYVFVGNSLTGVAGLSAGAPAGLADGRASPGGAVVAVELFELLALVAPTADAGGGAIRNVRGSQAHRPRSQVSRACRNLVRRIPSPPARRTTVARGGRFLPTPALIFKIAGRLRRVIWTRLAGIIPDSPLAGGWAHVRKR